ncbi:MAG: M48 family metallopeptidase, partial [Thermoanaerobaculia bacterium]|nr:M48 family metallopeptidase [Thermoanaerobaculia bacterium]
MDFFGRQDEARRRTKILVILFGLAVGAIVGAVYLAVVLLGLYFGWGSGLRIWDPALFLGVASATGVVVLGGSTYKIAALSRGGEAVAELLGGRPVEPDTEDLRERRLLNVVEEMAIASGTPVPTVYLLPEEPAINAFAAGFERDDAVVAVTRGCLEQLDRDELQGVVAHEFSHIFHGDTRLNLRLMGILHGILIIGLLGYWLLRSSRFSRGGSRRGKGNVLPLLGFALLIIGYVGVFFAKLIKSAVSRQREFLADASAVQYTRAPWGLTGALKKIGGWTDGSRIENPHAEEASHLFFGEGVGGALFRWMSTHPPLEERIRRLEPRFEGVTRTARRAGSAVGRAAASPGAGASALAGRSRRSDSTVPLRPEAAADQVGAPDSRHVEWGARLLRELPHDLRRGVREPEVARGIVLGLLVSRDEELRRRQVKKIAETADERLARRVEEALPELRGLSPRLRLPLVDL